MKLNTLAVLGALAVLAASTMFTPAQASYCERGFYAHARMANGLNYDPPRYYDARALARSRAIGIWKTKVRTYCPDHSAFWWRALDKRIQCEGYAGGVVCDIYGRPAHKFFH